MKAGLLRVPVCGVVNGKRTNMATGLLHAVLQNVPPSLCSGKRGGQYPVTPAVVRGVLGVRGGTRLESPAAVRPKL